MASGRDLAAARARKRSFRPVLLVLAAGITLSVVAWGYLVYAAIDFGSSARGGDSTAWWFLGLASVGAVACLFFGLMLVARLLRRLGITKAPERRRAVHRRRRRARAAPARSAAGEPLASGPAAGARTSAPDQVSSIAATLTSTQPRRSPRSRTAPSSRSLAMPSAFWAAFLGQHTHTIPAVAVRSKIAGSRDSRSASRVWKVRVTSRLDARQPAYDARAGLAQLEAVGRPVEQHHVLVLDPELAQQRGARVAGHAHAAVEKCREGRSHLAPPLVFPGPSSGVEAPDEICVARSTALSRRG